MHARELSALLLAPANVTDLIPFGFLMNRFSADLFIVDYDLMFNVGDVLFALAECTASIVISAVAVPWLLGVVGATLLLLVCLQRLYLVRASPFPERR